MYNIDIKPCAATAERMLVDMLYGSEEREKPGLTLLWESAAAFLCGLIFACTHLGSIVSPVPAAAGMCVSPVSSAAVLLGAITSGCITQTISEQAELIISLMLISCTRIILREYHSSRFVSIASCICVLIAGVVASFTENRGGAGILVSAMSGLLTGITSYFLYTVLSGIGSGRKIHLRSTAGCAAAVVYFILIAALSSFEISFINPGCVAGTAATLVASRRFRYTGGVICGSLAACGALLSGESEGLSLVFLPVTGMIAGYMADAGAFTSTAVFYLCSALAQLTVQSGSDAYTALGNLFLGCIISLFMSNICLDKWIVTEGTSVKHMMDNTAMNMQFMAETIGSVRADTERIAEVLSRPESGSTVCARVSEAVCAGCSSRSSCWESGSVAVQSGFVKLQRRAVAGDIRLPEELDKCGRKDELCISFKREQQLLERHRTSSIRKMENRSILFEQLSSAEYMLSSLGKNTAPRYSSQLTDSIERRLDRYGYAYESIAAYYNEKDRLVIEIYCTKKLSQSDTASICRILEEMLRISLEELEPVKTREWIRYRLSQNTAYRLRHYTAGLCANDGEVSGDTAVIYRDGTGSAYAVLSDGMGTGRAAAVESRMTAEMFRKLTSSGVSWEAAVRMINGLMFTKSDQETFATLDAVRFDLDSCQAEIIKSGAASTLIRHGEKVIRVCAPTFPVGTTANADIYSQTIRLSGGDMVVMMSDGVPESQYHFIKEMMVRDAEPSELAHEICQKSVIFSGGKCRDDVTVIVIVIEECQDEFTESH